MRESLTLILRSEGINILSANTVGQTEFQACGEQVRLVGASTKKRCSKKQESPGKLRCTGRVSIALI
ncbi:hypothetical protein [Floridanema aerugineum]|uniref:Uncharacterized protein n=1 Tax=Floridaenema aerugineum BLCC-F46 TaxID=3153654 RepID=A0ABV4WZ88_9CYAN